MLHVLPVFRPICLGRSLIYPLRVTLRAAPHSSETRRVRPRRHLTCCDGLHAPVLVSKSSRRAEWRFIPARDCPFCCCLAVSPLLALHDARDFRAGSDARHSGGKGGGDRLHDNKAGRRMQVRERGVGHPMRCRRAGEGEGARGLQRDESARQGKRGGPPPRPASTRPDRPRNVVSGE